MPTPFDQFLKELHCRLCAPFGEVQPSEEVVSDPQEADVVIRSDAPRVALPEIAAELSLVGRAYSRTCMVEGYHQTPGLNLVLECIRKQLALHHGRVLLASSAQLPPVPALWILSPGNPETAIDGLGFSPASDWPTGVYRGPQPLAPSWIVAISELPILPETLFWRLCGAGKVLGKAMAEVVQSSPASVVHRVALELMSRLELDLHKRLPGQLADEEKEFQMVSIEVFENFRRGLILESEAKGKAEGEARALLTVLATRGLAVSDEQRQRILACADLTQLERFVRQAVSAASTEEALG